jgi:hypothetical protein
LVSSPAPFATVVLPTPSRFVDAAQRFELEWRNVRRELATVWPEDLIDRLDGRLERLGHDNGAAAVAIGTAAGDVFVESLTIGVDRPAVTVGDAPALLPVIEHRQRTLPHVVVTVDRHGADIVAFDGGSVIEVDGVVPTTEYLHPGHSGGWTQRSLHQRSEQSWERNVGEIATAIRSVARSIGAVLVAISGEARARPAVAEALSGPGDRELFEVAEIESGTADGIADSTLRLLDDLHARLQLGVLEAVDVADDSLVGLDAVRPALTEGRVATLLVSGSNGGGPDRVWPPIGAPTFADLAVRDALATAADVVVVPHVAGLVDGVAALARWSR